MKVGFRNYIVHLFYLCWPYFCVGKEMLPTIKKDKVEVVTESYELWRARMLKKAYAELKQKEEEEAA